MKNALYCSIRRSKRTQGGEVGGPCRCESTIPRRTAWAIIDYIQLPRKLSTWIRADGSVGAPGGQFVACGKFPRHHVPGVLEGIVTNIG